MPESNFAPLAARPALFGSSAQIGSATLRVIAEKALFVLSVKNAQVLCDSLGAMPEPGRSVGTENGSILWTGAQVAMVFAESPALTEADLARQITASGYVTDISDGWIALSLCGLLALALLDRIALPDLSGDNFPVGSVISTKISHMRVVIWHRRAEEALILSTSSFSGSLWHSLTKELAQAARHREFSA